MLAGHVLVDAFGEFVDGQWYTGPMPHPGDPKRADEIRQRPLVPADDSEAPGVCDIAPNSRQSGDLADVGAQHRHLFEFERGRREQPGILFQPPPGNRRVPVAIEDGRRRCVQ